MSNPYFRAWVITSVVFLVALLLLRAHLGYSPLASGLIALNLTSIFMMGFDKALSRVAEREMGKKWRVPEFVMWTLALLGGGVGTFMGMHFFRHKSKKASFQLALTMIVLLQAMVFSIMSQYLK